MARERAYEADRGPEKGPGSGPVRSRSMPTTLSREHRRLLENTVAQARAVAEEGARKVLRDQYAVHHHEPWPHMSAKDRDLRKQLRAHGRQLGDLRDARRETQE